MTPYYNQATLMKIINETSSPYNCDEHSEVEINHTCVDTDGLVHGIQANNQIKKI
jgi:hypothetical protein